MNNPDLLRCFVEYDYKIYDDDAVTEWVRIKVQEETPIKVQVESVYENGFCSIDVLIERYESIIKGLEYIKELYENNK